MKIVVAHNAYQQYGCEDVVCQNEILLLREHGHEVREYFDDNRRISELSSLQLGLETMWSRRSYDRMTDLLQEFAADVVHLHNIFPLISPSVYYAARKSRVAVVQTLHNFRLLCPNGIFLRNGKVCEDCLGKWVPLPSIQHKCYHNSGIASAGVAAMVTLHRALRTWHNQVDIYLALSEFARAKFVTGGLPESKIIVKPNCLPRDPGAGAGEGGFALYVGRLSPEKGIATLLAAWEKVGPRIPLKLAGDGPESARVQEAANRLPGIVWLGRQPHEQVLSLLKQASFLVLPSICYENFPLTIVEAYACGTPVMASRLGSMQEIVRHDKTGLLFTVGDADDLATQVKWVLSHPERMLEMRITARAEFEAKYTAEKNHHRLMSIYESAVHDSNRRFPVSSFAVPSAHGAAKKPLPDRSSINHSGENIPCKLGVCLLPVPEGSSGTISSSV